MQISLFVIVSTKTKKQVRFADTAGEGPLWKVYKEKKPKMKSKGSKKKQPKVEKTKPNSWSCTIF